MMSSPARSSASATSVGAQGGGGAGSSSTAGFGDDAASTCPFSREVTTPQDRKDEAVAVLKAELMAALDKEVKSLDRDSWMFAGPRSQIHLISRPEFSASCCSLACPSLSKLMIVQLYNHTTNLQLQNSFSKRPC